MFAAQGSIQFPSTYQGPKAPAKFETVYLLFTTSSYFFVCGGGSRKSKCHQNKSFHCNSKKVRENF